MIRFAEELTRSLEEEDRQIHLVALGGDGTVNEILQGIRDFSRTRFSYIPTGSSNDLARDAHISRNPIEALEQFLSGKERPMDVGVLTYHTAFLPDGKGLRRADSPERYFLVSCGIGFDASVSQEAMTSSIKDILNRLGLGKLTYLGIALKQLITSVRPKARLIIKEGDQTISLSRMLFIACMSHCYEGGGFCFCPGADASDGLLDLCSVDDVPIWKVLLLLPTAFWGGHYRYKGVQRHTASSLQIRTSRPLWVHTDGEVAVLSDDISISCRQELLRFIY